LKTFTHELLTGKMKFNEQFEAGYKRKSFKIKVLKDFVTVW